MTDCLNVDVKDLLPDYLNGSLHATARKMVDEHLSSCADCREELDVVAAVRSAFAAPDVDIARISSALPAYRKQRSWAVSPSMLRVAAGIALLAVGTASYSIINPGGLFSVTRGEGDSSAFRLDSVRPVAGEYSDPLAVSNQLDLLDDESLAAFIEAVGKIEAEIPAEPRSIVASLKFSGELE